MTNTRQILTAALLAALAACADRTATDPRYPGDPPDFAKGGGGGDPTVTGTSPTDAPVDTTLNIRVYGSNFDRNSRADLALAGVIGPKVRTNSTSYVSTSELLANVTIAIDADTGAYDVVVMTSTGKKGIGTEMFRVRKGPKPPPPPLPGLVAIDLDEGVFANHHGYGVSDSGWVFAANWGGPGLAWLTRTPHDSTVLPAQVVNPNGGNGRGDYIAYDEDAVMLRGTSGWTLGPTLAAPDGWPSDPLYLHAINDARLVVGWAKDPNRCTTTTQGGTTSTYCRQSPLAWTYDAAAGSWTTQVMTLPAASDPASCRVRGVIPVRVNDAGMVVGYATEDALTRRAVCPQRAIVWPTVSGAPVALPTSGTLPGYTYDPEDINDRGDITGTAYSGSDYRAVRWWAGTGTVEVLNGYYASGEAIDECGRVVTTQGYLWEADGSVVMRLLAPTEFTGLKVRDIARGVAVGEAGHSTLGWHALVWQLSACTPAP